MSETLLLRPIGVIHSEFPEKFGIPRQSGLADELRSVITFYPEYATMDCVKGIEEYDYLWLIWQFQGVERSTFHATVRPPRLGGNTHMGVFATRSPFRPNPIGLSCVKLIEVKDTADGPRLVVAGADLKDQTPILDIKPYLPYVEAHPEARGGFTDWTKDYRLEVVFPEEYQEMIPEQLRKALLQVLSQDPRPSYQDDSERVYGMMFSGYNVKFTVRGNQLTVCQIER